MEQLELKSVITACQMDELSPADQHLMSLAIEATQRSYAPYSHFHVGAAVRLDNGVEILGCNQENAAYPSGLCAERTALFAAGVQYPDVGVNTLAIAARGTDGELLEEPCSPCGSCRQVIIETSIPSVSCSTVAVASTSSTASVSSCPCCSLSSNNSPYPWLSIVR